MKKTQTKTVQINGKGLFSKEEVIVSIHKLENSKKIVFTLNNERIEANVKNVTNTLRNTVLGKGSETLCLIEHFLSACSVLGINGIEVTTNRNELVFEDGSALHWQKLFIENSLHTNVESLYDLKEPIYISDGDKSISAIPSNGFTVNYFMDYSHPAIGKQFATWSKGDDIEKLLRARTFGKKEENDFFGVSGRVLSLGKDSFDMELHEANEPAMHKALDIIGDLRLCGVNPLEINMTVTSHKAGHSMNVELAKKIQEQLGLE